jgi:hypothetical protein
LHGYWFLTTVIERHAELPAALYARTVTVLFPTSKGIDVDQVVVPVAVPWPPVDVVHCTEVVLLFAVPLTAIVEAETETIVEAGETMLRVGGAVLAPLEVLVAPVPVPALPEPPELPVAVLPLVLPPLPPDPAPDVPELPLDPEPPLPELPLDAGGAMAPAGAPYRA